MKPTSLQKAFFCAGVFLLLAGCQAQEQVTEPEPSHAEQNTKVSINVVAPDGENTGTAAVDENIAPEDVLDETSGNVE